jgi:hypothetical protein
MNFMEESQSSEDEEESQAINSEMSDENTILLLEIKGTMNKLFRKVGKMNMALKYTQANQGVL